MAINSSKVDEEQKEVLKSATIRRLFSYLKNYKRQVAVVLVVLAVTIAISTVNPLLLEYAIDVNIAQKDWRGLVALCVFMVVINLVYAAGVRLRMLLMARITNNILLEIRDELYTHRSSHIRDGRRSGKNLPMLRRISTRTSPVSASSRALPQSRNRRASLTGFFLSIRTPLSMRSAWRMVFPL